MQSIVKTISSLLVITLPAVALGQQVQARETGSFSRLELSGAVELYYTHSDSLKLTVHADGDDMEKVETKFEKGTLHVHTRGKVSDVKVYVYNNALTEVDVSGASGFISETTIPAQKLKIEVTGAAELRAKVETSELDCEASGAAEVSLSGKTGTLDARLEGASELKAYDLESREARISASGASSARINASENVKADASGASDVRVKGEPKNIEADVSSAASVSRVKGSGKSENAADTVRYDFNKKKVLVIRKDEDRPRKKKKQVSNASFDHWAGFSAGFNGYFTPSGSLSMPRPQRFLDLNYARSFNFQFNPFEHGFKLARNYVRLVVGLGLDYHQYAFSNNTRLDADTSYTWGAIDSTRTFNYKKNQLRATYLQVPLLLEFNTSNNPKKTFHIAFGVIGEYKIGSRTKTFLTQGRDEVEITRKDNYNLNPFLAKAHVNLGYRGWTVFAEYGLSPLFTRGKGPDVVPFAAGLRIIPFS
jgi:hypothetical protein